MRVDEAYNKMPRGMIDLIHSTRVFPPPRPTTLGGWLAVVRGTLLCDVLRLCVYEGCWHRAGYGTLLSGRMCASHYMDYYTDE